MAERSHFLALLSQTGWTCAELGVGRVRAVIERTGVHFEARIFEGSALLSRALAQGVGAREIIGAMRVSEGLWLDTLGEEGAWAKSLAIFMEMKSVSLGVDAPMPAGDALGISLKHRPESKGGA